MRVKRMRPSQLSENEFKERRGINRDAHLATASRDILCRKLRTVIGMSGCMCLTQAWSLQLARDGANDVRGMSNTDARWHLARLVSRDSSRADEPRRTKPRRTLLLKIDQIAAPEGRFLSQPGVELGRGPSDALQDERLAKGD